MMVSIAGYGLFELVVYIVLSYVLVLANGIVMVMHSILDEEEGLDNRNRRTIIFFVALLSITIMYFFQIRIGTINFINGIIFAWLFFQLKDLLGRWNPLVEGKEEALKAIAK